MKRHLNLCIWIGFLIVVASLISYIPVFTPFAPTRDVPWPNYILFLIGGVLLAFGLRRAFFDSGRYRGKVSGSILGVLSLLLVGLFAAFVGYAGKQIPAAGNALRTGQRAPAFALADTAGNLVSSSGLLVNHRAILLIFYRGYW